MRKIPVAIQQDAMDCGVACISMICRWYGMPIPIPELKKVCIPTREGVSLKRIALTLEDLGFNVVGGRSTVRLLAEKATLPVILHWEQQHFVVLFKVSSRRGKYRFHVSDPACGVVVYTQEDFERHWVSTRTHGEDKGVALFVYYNGQVARFKHPGRKEIVHWGTLLPYFSRYKYFFLLLAVGYVLLSLVQLLFPYLTKSLVDIGIGKGNLQYVILILVGQLVLLLGSTSVRLVNNWVTLHISTRVSISLVSDFLIKLMKLPMDFFDNKKVGDIVQRIGDHGRVERFVTTQSLSLLYSLVTLFVFGAVMLSYNRMIFAVFALFSAAYFLWLVIFMKKRKVLDYKFFAINSESQNVTYRLISGMQESKLQDNAREQRWKWEDVRVDLFEANMEQLKLTQRQQVGSMFINEAKNIVVTVLAASAVIEGSITLGMMLAIQYIIGQLSVPVSQLANYLYEIQDVRISLDRIHEVKNKKDENEGRTALLDTAEPSISICNLSFRYEGMAEDVIRDVNLVIRPQETVAIVGSSGSGKTTLLKLMLQYYQPCEGCISIGGVDLRRVNLQSLWGRCGVVMQDGYIFSDTIARNIAATGGEVDHARLEYAADVAMLKDFVESLPLKYDTLIGDEGRNLSSGQRQRVLIARAVYKNPDILFFDEATNALDATNEKCILQNLETFLKGRTAVIIAHRLSTVKNADKIVVLEGGRIVENGTHAGLLAEHGAYYRLVKNQLELGG